MHRRTFLTTAGILAAGAVAPACSTESHRPDSENGAATALAPSNGWVSVRNQFALSPDVVHMSALLVSTHPRTVRDAIDRYRRELDADPVRYLRSENASKRQAAREAAGHYLGAQADEIALTDSTTMGIAIVYQGLQLEEGDEVLTTEHAYYATYEALRQVTGRTGASVREIRLYDEPSAASTDQIVQRIDEAITPETRAVALTWVHSSTGVKLPIGRIAEVVAEHNSGRGDVDRILVCVDGVHGFGIENFEIRDLGCDFFMAGAHKWLFGPRGTGVVWGRSDAWPRLRPTIPSFIEGASWDAWAVGSDPPGPTTAERMTPGGFKPFEHQWAMADAFDFHQEVGKDRIADRTHELNARLKDGLVEMDHVTLHTPLSEELSSGIVCFEVDGHSPNAVIDHLERGGIIGTTTPYAVTYPRLTPSIYNTPEEVEAALDVIAGLG